MAVHSFTRLQHIPVSLNEAWDFFTSPQNLEKITPPKLKFNIISKQHVEHTYAGQLIEYTVKPILGIPLYWMTEITHVQPGEYFVDEQRYGPYSLWHHQHHFRQMNQGTEMRDIIHYKILPGFLGTLANNLFVRDELTRIFDFRYKKIEEFFGVKASFSQENCLSAIEKVKHICT